MYHKYLYIFFNTMCIDWAIVFWQLCWEIVFLYARFYWARTILCFRFFFRNLSLLLLVFLDVKFPTHIHFIGFVTNCSENIFFLSLFHTENQTFYGRGEKTLFYMILYDLFCVPSKTFVGLKSKIFHRII